MTEEVYLSSCTCKSGKITHKIFNISRKHGYKLQCLNCGKIRKRYTKNPTPAGKEAQDVSRN